jgi:hypothetical protein
MLQQLDAEKDKGTITAYGVSLTTLDEVFLLVARGDDARKQQESFKSSLFNSISNNANQDDDGERSGKSMDLENDNLFGRHVHALWKKRVASFKRDKKAWCCTTVTPSIFVLVGLLILKYAVPNRDLQALRLDLNDYNAGTITSPEIRNPISFNSPELYFGCNPGQCTMRSSYVVDETNETYYFCGGPALDSSRSESCLIRDSKLVVDQVDEAGATAIPLDQEAIDEVCANVVLDDSSPIMVITCVALQTLGYLLATSFTLPASMYGGLFFMHDAASVTKSNFTYGETMSELCLNNTGDYMQESECDLYGTGIGYTVAYNYTALHSAVS